MDIYRKALEWLEEGRVFAFGTVIHAEGSTPQKAGSKAILDSSGNQEGTLGGGLVEADGLSRMQKAINGQTVDLYEFRLDEDYSRAAGPICGGVMRLFTNPKTAENADSIRRALDALTRRERGVLLTVLDGEPQRAGTVAWVPVGNGASAPPFVSQAVIDRCLQDEAPVVIRAESGEEVFLEPVAPMPRLLIVGAGHVGQAVARQGVELGFEVTVYDDRPNLATPDLFPPGVQTGHGDLRELVAAFPKDDDTYIVLVSKGHKPDAEALEACIHSRLAYLGMIGSKRKIHFLRENFIEEGLATPEVFDRVVAPIGYDIGAVTVPEIAVSIASQLIAARRRPSAVRDVGPMILRQ